MFFIITFAIVLQNITKMIKAIAQHRSIRNFRDCEIHPAIMQQMLRAATRASNTGGMQLYSIVVSQRAEVKAQLAPCHFNQPMVTQAAAVVTFCADVNRFSQWCRLRGATPAYHNFGWWVSASTDALLASENFALEAEDLNLGICYLGTTLYSAGKIIDILELPKGVIPVMTIAVGYPAEPLPELTPRLSLEAVVHNETYQEYTPELIDELYAELEASEATAELIRQNGLPNLARIFTEKRYTEKDNLAFSESYYNALVAQGFL